MRQTRNTPQKQLILSIMENNFNHPTADEIYSLARERDTRISRGTVYRNLNQLAEDNILLRLAMPVGPDHYDCNIANHYHFICRCCGKVTDTQLDEDMLVIKQADLKDYEIESLWLVLSGLCPSCRFQDKHI